MVVSSPLDIQGGLADDSSWIDEIRGTWDDLFRKSTLSPWSRQDTDVPAVSFAWLDSLSDSLQPAPENLTQIHSPSNQ